MIHFLYERAAQTRRMKREKNREGNALFHLEMSDVAVWF